MCRLRYCHLAKSLLGLGSFALESSNSLLEVLVVGLEFGDLFPLVVELFLDSLYLSGEIVNVYIVSDLGRPFLGGLDTIR